MHHRPNAAPNAAGVSPRAKTASKAETCLNRTDFGFRRCLAPDKLPDTKDRRGDSKPGDCRHVQNLLAVEAKGVHGVVHQGSESILDERLGNQHGGRCSSNDGRCLSMISKFPTIEPLLQDRRNCPSYCTSSRDPSRAAHPSNSGYRVGARTMSVLHQPAHHERAFTAIQNLPSRDRLVNTVPHAATSVPKHCAASVPKHCLRRQFQSTLERQFKSTLQRECEARCRVSSKMVAILAT